MFGQPHHCKYCGDELVYGDKHGACELGSPQDQEYARWVMNGNPADIYCKKGVTVKDCKYTNHDICLCLLDNNVCEGSRSNN